MFLISALLGVFFSFATVPDKGQLTIHITNIRSDKGVIAVALFKGSDGYPSEGNKADRKVRVSISGGKAVVVVDDLPYGDYAIAYMHDENNNGKMDYNFVGIPKEGFGASNNAVGNFSPPKYEDARFSLKQGELSLTMKTRYF